MASGPRFRTHYQSSSGAYIGGINWGHPKSKYRFNEQNGEVKVIKSADPEKLKAYQESKKGKYAKRTV